MFNEIKNGAKLLKLAVRGTLPLDLFLTETATIPGFSIFLLITHWLILIGVILRASLYRDYYSASSNQFQSALLLVSIVLFFIFLISLSLIEFFRSELARKSTYMWGKIVLDVLFFSIFYFTTGKEESDLFLLYLLPLFVVIERSNFRRFILFTVFILACFASVILLLAPSSTRTIEELALNVFFFRGSLLLFVGIVGLFFSRTLTVQKSVFLGMLTTMGNGVSVIDSNMRLLWVNRFEQELTSSAMPGEICYKSFHDRDSACENCPVLNVFKTGKEHSATVYHQVNGEELAFELSSAPIRDQGHKIVAALTVANNVTGRERQARRLSILQTINGLVRTTEINQPERLDEILWRILAGVVATDGLAFERVILFLEQGGQLVGKQGIGPLNAKEAQDQFSTWKRTELPWTYEQIGNMRGDLRISSRELNNRISQVVLANVNSDQVNSFQSENSLPKAKWLICDKANGLVEAITTALGNSVEWDKFAIAPLISKGALIGILLADDVVISRNRDDRDLGYFQLYADQAAIAFEMARSINEFQENIKELTGLQNILEALNKNSLEMSEKQLDLQGLLKAIVKGGTELLNAHGGSIYMKTREDELRAVVVESLDPFLDLRLKIGEGITGHVAQTGEPMIVDNYHTSPYRVPRLSEEPYKSHVRAVVKVPLFWQNKVIGVLGFSDIAEGRVFTKKDVALLGRFADAAANAIGNARVHAYLQTLVKSSPDAIIAIDQLGMVTEFNEAAERILGFSKDEVLGTYVSVYYFEGEKEARRINSLLIDADKKGERIKEFRTFVKGKQGDKIPIRFSGAVLKDELGERIGSIGLMTDLRGIQLEEREYRTQQDFLARLEQLPQDIPIQNLENLRDRLTRLLNATREFCDIEYIALFASIKEDETVLQAIASSGLPAVVKAQLPHFNWRKAGLLSSDVEHSIALENEAGLIASWMPGIDWKDKTIMGIRGQNADFFKGLSIGIPYRLADNYRSMLVMGPFDGNPDLLKMSDFLKNISATISSNSLSWLQALYLRAKQEESERSATLIVHRARMSLMQVMGKLGFVKEQSLARSTVWQAAEEGEGMVYNLSNVIKKSLTSRIAEMEIEDFKFQYYSLSALLQNCVESSHEMAKRQDRELVVDPKVENLPYADVDPILLSVALGNLIENAIKYSLESPINIYATYDTEQATIFVEDTGEAMPQKAHENLIRPGKRWGMSPRAREIPGTGYGLWDASVIASAHMGTLDFSSEFKRQRQNKAIHEVIIWITLPLRRPLPKKGRKG